MAPARGSSSRAKAHPRFKHTVAEFEDEVNKEIIRMCKIDACVDRFLHSLITSKPDYNPGRYSSFPSLDSFDHPALERITQELQEDLNRLVPEFLDGQSLNLEDKTVQKAFMNRWKPVVTVLRSEHQDCVPKGLLDVLMEKQLQQRSGTRQGSRSTEEQAAFVESCRQLKDLADGQQSTASFACGGAIPIATTETSQSEGIQSSDPVNIFWAEEDDGTHARRLTLPLAHESSPGALEALVHACSPATFGRGQQDVMDESYRKAGKLNPDQFATSFHPADFGIIETIGRILLPTMSSEQGLRSHRIHAELYKLNIYSGPSGLFRSHVDTPRSSQQIGSLVICLPSPFQGGSLVVRHHGQETEFDWSANTSSIQWAAFYSDCEHEIKTITEGDRITLTYNLYITEQENGVVPSTFDPKTLPLYGWMKNHLAKPGFMDEGGVLGMFCAHAYPTTSDTSQTLLPQALKGADLALYSSFQSLGLEVEILPVLRYDGQYFAKNTELGLSGTVGGRSPYSYGHYGSEETMMKYLKQGELRSIYYSELLPSSNDFADVDRRWKLLMLTRRVEGMGDALDFAEKENLAKNPGQSFYEMEGARVGSCRRPYEAHDREQDETEDFENIVKDLWPCYYLPGITWITEPKHEELAFTHLAYGNETSMSTQYSCAAIFAAVPPFDQRAEKFT